MRRPLVWLCLILTLTAALSYSSLNLSSFGFYHDDSVYAVTARAIATGQGYKYISLPDEPTQTLYPPLYPLLLSIVWRLWPDLPQSLLPMMLFSILASLALVAMVFLYFRNRPGLSETQALLLTALVAFNFYTLRTSTAILTEMVYTLLVIASLYLLEDRKAVLYASALIALACLTRSVGVSLAAAAITYYLLRRDFSRAAIVAVLPGVALLLWAVWSGLNGSAESSSESYMAVIGAVISEEGVSGFIRLVVKSTVNILLTIPIVSLGLSSHWIALCGFILIFVAGGFIRTAKLRIGILHIYTIMYLSIHALWPYGTYDRFIFPLLPFLWYFIIVECAALWKTTGINLRSPSRENRAGAVFISAMLIVFAGLICFSYIRSSIWAMTTGEKNEALSPHDREAIEWIKGNTQPWEIIVCEWDVVYYLFTGRKTLPTVLKRDAARIGLNASSDVLLKRVPHLDRADYLITSDARIAEALQCHPVFHSKDGRTVIYRIEKPVVLKTLR